MGQARQRRRILDPFNISRTIKMSEKQWRTLQMFTDKFDMLNESEALRHAIDTYMTKSLEESTTAAVSGSKPAFKPVISVATPEIAATSDDDMRPPPVISRSDLPEDEGPSLSDQIRAARAQPAMNQAEPERWASLKDDL